MAIDEAEVEETLANARRALLAERNANGYWEGELSSSALSTATAVFALSLLPDSHRYQASIRAGLAWLVANQNKDGGWGDTVKSFSNISTTALCWAAFAAGSDDAIYSECVSRAARWLTEGAGGIDPDHLIPAIIARYGKDHTFSVPILTMCALAGRLGAGREAWRRIPQLPFELAAFPQRWFKWLRLPVVSYALPALIAIGLVRHRMRPGNPVARAGRNLAVGRALTLLERIQPSSGGFLEATPLTSFVVMSLAGAGLGDHAVARKGAEFLARSARADGSWPIDTNLATWVTTLSVNALANDPDFERHLPAGERAKIRDWLLGQQYRVEHPYTLADPGCWAWTDLPGGVPDADDTAGAMLALANLDHDDPRCEQAALAGAAWLANLQNRDYGIPTFCRGWGKLPFDRSSADLTAHALRAWAAWGERAGGEMWGAIDVAGMRGLSYLRRCQREDGAWAPLWFGNQHAPDEVNLTYGTSRVLLATPGIRSEKWGESVAKAVEWLRRSQNADGGWGGAPGAPSTIEETALAVEALATVAGKQQTASDPCLSRGVEWLVRDTEGGRRFEATPIGFYFAKLWYYEKLYPLTFTVAALGAYKRLRVGSPAAAPSPAQ